MNNAYRLTLPSSLESSVYMYDVCVQLSPFLFLSHEPGCKFRPIMNKPDVRVRKDHSLLYLNVVGGPRGECV